MRLRHRAMLVLALVGISKAPLPQAQAQATPADAVASKSAGSAVPTLPDDRLGVRIAPLLLLSRPDVRTEVKLTPDQEAQALAAISDLHGRAVGDERDASRSGKTCSKTDRRSAGQLGARPSLGRTTRSSHANRPAMGRTRRPGDPSLRRRFGRTERVANRDHSAGRRPPKRRAQVGDVFQSRRTRTRHFGLGPADGRPESSLEIDSGEPVHVSLGRVGPHADDHAIAALAHAQASGAGPTVRRSNSGLPRRESKSDSSAISVRRCGSSSRATESSSRALAGLLARHQ